MFIPVFIPEYVPSGKSRRENRRLLLSHSFFMKRLVKRAREEIGVSKDGKYGFEKRDKFVEWRAHIIENVRQKDRRKKKDSYKFKEILPGISNALSVVLAPLNIQLERFAYLNLESDFVEQLVLASMDSPKFWLGDSRGIRVVISHNDPINEVGVWMKWEPNLKEKDIAALYKEADSVATQSYFSELLFQNNKLSKNERNRANLTAYQCRVYRTIEELFEKLYEEFDRVTLLRVLNELPDDLKLKKESVKSVYEDLKKRYNLPSHLDAKKVDE